MFKFIKKVIAVATVLSLFTLGTIFADKQYLKDGLVRLHVVANSNSSEDQKIKLRVRDALLDYFAENMSGIVDAAEAKNFLNSHLNQIQQTANETLSSLGICDTAKVTFREEEFGVRQYATFTLPSGIYDSIRVEIGNAQGENWWCVVFPALCNGATGEDFKSAAASSGFHNGLTNALAQDKGYEIRFFFLDCLGRIENLFAKK